MRDEVTSPVRILCVDDNVDELTLFEVFFNRLLPAVLHRPVSVVSVLDGVSALETLREQTFDLVVTDLSMSGMSGDELIQQIRDGESERGGASTPRGVKILVLSSVVFYELRGADAFMEKPSLATDLVDTVGRLLLDGEAAK